MKKIVYVVNGDVEIKNVMGYKNEVYYHGIMALKAITEEVVMVVLDLGLYRVTAMDLISIIRRNPKMHHVRIVVCSRTTNFRLLKRAIQNGADYILPFPLDEGKVKEILKRMEDKDKLLLDFFRETQTNNPKLSLQKSKIEV